MWKLGRNKRKFIRLQAHHLLKYKLVSGKKSQNFLSFARNISAGGVLFYSHEPAAVGSVVELVINVPSYPKAVKVVSKVIRVKKLKKLGKYEIGAEFINMEEDARDFINNKILKVFGKRDKD